jgi:hypothetical protein
LEQVVTEGRDQQAQDNKQERLGYFMATLLASMMGDGQEMRNAE